MRIRCREKEIEKSITAKQWFIHGDDKEVQRQSFIAIRIGIIQMDSSENHHGVCPGDWIIRYNGRVKNVISNKIFKQLYEII